ncbi:MAG: hypothetical protein KJO75_07270 [Dactylosporangium sp.]|nr:hypothetical protein [Dactylosporangium sp.]
MAAEPSIGVVPTVTSFVTQALPLDRYQASVEENRTIRMAHDILIRDCMRRIGFSDYTEPSAENEHLAEKPTKFGFLDEGRAANAGFHDPQAVDRQSPAHQDASGASDSATSNPVEIAALAGAAPPGTDATAPAATPPGGCTAAATRLFREGLRSDDRPLAADLQAAAEERTLADSRVITATRSWAACMRRAGYTYRTPADPLTEQWAARPTPTEIAIAKADVVCTRETNLPGIAVAVMAAIQREQVATHRAALETGRSVIDEYVRKARTIIDGGSG